jgi:hypothetical protein
MATFVKPFGVCESSRWLVWRKKLVEVDMIFFLHVYAMFTPPNIHATDLSLHVVSFALQTNHLLCYFSNFTPLELGQYSCVHGFYKWPTH